MHRQLLALKVMSTSVQLDRSGPLWLARLRNRPLWWVFAVWVIGLVITIALTLWIRHLQQERLHTRFDAEFERVIDDVQRRFQMPAYGLMGARGVYAASDSLDRQSFRRYVESRNLPVEFPGLRGIGFIERVARPELDDFVRMARADGEPGFTVRELGDGKADLYVIKYIEPMAPNRAALGLDVGSEAVRREGAERAARSGQPALSAVIRLVQDNQSRPGFLLYVPVFRPGLPLNAPEERQAALLGLMYSPIVLEELLTPGLELLRTSGLHVQISDKPVSESSESLFQTDRAPPRPLLSVERPFVNNGLTLFIRAQSTPELEASANDLLVIVLGAAGALLSTLLSWVLWLQATGLARAEARAKSMTLDLHKLALVAEGTANVVFMTDADLRITWVNGGFSRTYGYTLQESIGATPGELLGSGLADPVSLKKLEEASKQGVACRVEILNRAKDGRTCWIDTEVQPIHDDAGRLTGFIEIGLDITQQKEQAVALLAAKDQAEQANLAKSQFLANISHEIRTPLNAVLGMHRMLNATPLEPPQSDLLGKADQAGHALMDIINNVLDLAKIEAGEMSLSAEPLQPRVLFDELMSIHGPVAQAKGIALTLETAADVPMWIVGDRFRLRQVLSNLLGNAIKFTSAGSVKLSAHVKKDAQQQTIELLVQDSGVGISQEAIGRLFTPFAQADESTTRQFGGTGLGLSIVRNLAHMMDGSARVSSKLGEGSVFSVTLPLVEADAQSVAEAARASRPIEVAVMCADDDMGRDVNLRLAALGWTCFRPLASEPGDPDVLLMDTALGDAGAARLMELVNSRQVKGNDLPVIWLGDVRELGDGRWQTLPRQRTVNKPAEISTVFNAVVEMLAQVDSIQDRLIGNAQAISGGVCWLQGARILVVDDSEINLEIAVALLTQQGAECHTCGNGQEAVDWLMANPSEVDAVLMDVQMPVLDGLAATRLIKTHEAFQRLPVIALTAGALASERHRATEAGMDDFLTKPLEPLEVVRVLRHRIGQQRGLAPLVALMRPGEDSVGAESTDADPWPEIPGIDKALAMAYSSNSVALFRKLLALVQKNYSTWSATWLELARLKGPAINTDLQASLHKLRGSAGMLGAVDLAAAAELAESSIEDTLVSPLDAVARVAKVLDELLVNVTNGMNAESARHDAVQPLDVLTNSARQQLSALATLLTQHDMDALDAAANLRAELFCLMGQGAADNLLQTMESLDFNSAHALLSSKLQQLVATQRPLFIE